MNTTKNRINVIIGDIMVLLSVLHGQEISAQTTMIPDRWKIPMEVHPLYHCDTVTVCAIGDVMMHEGQILAARKDRETYDFSTYFRHIGDRIRNADIAVANMEFTLAGEPYTGYPSFSAPDSMADCLAESGFDVILTANNHILDKGRKGAERTLEELKEPGRNFRFTGMASDEEDMAGLHPLILNVKGIRVAFLNMTYGTNSSIGNAWPKVFRLSDKKTVEDALAKAEKEADITIVMPHWGEEYSLRHSEHQRSTAEWLVSHGADVILGTHPHVVQDCETLYAPDKDDSSVTRSAFVAYSLGNAISNMSARNTQLGLMATVRIVRHGNGDIGLLPVRFTWTWCSRPGGFCDSYTILPVTEHMDSNDGWQGRWEHEKMITTCERVRRETGIQAD